MSTDVSPQRVLLITIRASLEAEDTVLLTGTVDLAVMLIGARLMDTFQ